MSEDAQATTTAAPITNELLESLAADYKAGRLPDDVMERIEALRDGYVESAQDRFRDVTDDVKIGIDEFVLDLNAQLRAHEADAGPENSEVSDSRVVTAMANAVDAYKAQVVEPVIDAVEDVVLDTFDVARELVQIRAEHDPEGLYAPKLDAAQAELDQAGDAFDTEIEAVHVRIDAVHDEMEQLRDDAEEFHQHHAPMQIIRSTTVDPNLPEQMAEETGEGVA